MGNDDLREKLAQVALAEFAALREEISNRTDAQNTMVNITLVAVSAIGTLIFTYDQAGAAVALVLGPLCAATGLLWLDNASTIFRIGEYIKIELWGILTYSAHNTDTQEQPSERLPGEFRGWEKYTLRSEHKTLVGARWVLIVPFFVIFIGPMIFAIAANVRNEEFWVRLGVGTDTVLLFGLLGVWIPFLVHAMKKSNTQPTVPAEASGPPSPSSGSTPSPAS